MYNGWLGSLGSLCSLGLVGVLPTHSLNLSANRKRNQQFKVTTAASPNPDGTNSFNNGCSPTACPDHVSTGDFVHQGEGGYNIRVIVHCESCTCSCFSSNLSYSVSIPFLNKNAQLDTLRPSPVVRKLIFFLNIGCACLKGYEGSIVPSNMVSYFRAHAGYHNPNLHTKRRWVFHPMFHHLYTMIQQGLPSPQTLISPKKWC